MKVGVTSAVKVQVESWKIAQVLAAQRLGINRPRLNDLLQGKLEKFSLDAQVNLAAASGLVLEMKIAAARCNVSRLSAV